MAETKKVTKKGVKKLILFYLDPKTKEHRLVILGEIEKVIPFFMELMEAGMDRFQKIMKRTSGKDVSKKELLDILDETKPEWANKHAHEVRTGTSLMDISYQLKEGSKRTKKKKIKK